MPLIFKSRKFAYTAALLLLFMLAGAFTLRYLPPPTLFKNGDRVCFVGNSITHEGQFTGYIALYYATRYPHEKVYFFNAGIAGDEASDILARMDSDVLIHRPTHTVLMVGMNDVRRDLYDLKNAGDTAVDHQKQKVLDAYQVNVNKIADRFQQRGIKQVFELPTIYDETGRFSPINATGINAALGFCAGFLTAQAPRYQAGIVDYYALMNRINTEGQQKDSTFTIIGPDRVHPHEPGNLVMAYQFIKSTGAATIVSKTVIDAADTRVLENVNCKAQIKSGDASRLQFESLEEALPYPVEAAALPALNYISFTEDLNQEILQVNNLQPGNYILKIDQAKVGTYTAADLSAGINLATDTLTPQYRQALKVMQQCDAYHQTWLNLRGIAFVEYATLGKRRQDGYVKNRRYLDSLKETNEYLAAKNLQYITYKPKQAVLFKQLDLIRDEIYRVNKPVKHRFELTMVR